MTKTTLRLALTAGALGLAALTAGCAKTGADAAKPAATDAAQVEKALRDNETQWNADYKAKDIAKILAHYAPDATLMEPDGPVMTGADNLKKGLTEFIADPALDLQFSADRVGVAEGGDMAYTRGAYRLTATDPKTKKPMTQTGSYVTVYKKQADGSWKAVEDIASPTQAAPPPAAPKAG